MAAIQEVGFHLLPPTCSGIPLLSYLMEVPPSVSLQRREVLRVYVFSRGKVCVLSDTKFHPEEEPWMMYALYILFLPPASLKRGMSVYGAVKHWVRYAAGFLTSAAPGMRLVSLYELCSLPLPAVVWLPFGLH